MPAKRLGPYKNLLPSWGFRAMVHSMSTADPNMSRRQGWGSGEAISAFPGLVTSILMQETKRFDDRSSFLIGCVLWFYPFSNVSHLSNFMKLFCYQKKVMGWGR